MTTIKHIKKLDQGKQGITGLVNIDGERYVYKLSQFLNYLPEHEHLIMKGLNELSTFCPHFCSSLGLRTMNIHPDFREDDQDPFEPHRKSLQLKVLLMEYIEFSIPLLSLIETEGVKFDSIITSIKQVLMAIVIAQQHKRFTHYDLHSLNILIKSCPVNRVHLYVMDDENVFCIPTHGVCPVIIDYGFSTSQDFDGQPMYCSLAYTDAGYLSPAFDHLVDFKLFLVSIAEDLYENRHFHYNPIKKFRNTVKNLFKPLEINWKSGWDINRDSPIIDQVYHQIMYDDDSSELFTRFSHYCIDMLQSLIRLPLVPSVISTMKELRRAYHAFAEEFIKIETEIQNTFYSLYVFRKTIDAVQALGPMYINEETRGDAVSQLRQEIFTVVSTVAKFCTLKGVHFEKMMCSLLVFQDHLKTQLYYLLQAHLTNKDLEYDQLQVQRPELIYGVIDFNFPSKYTFQEDTEIVVYDAHMKRNDTFSPQAKYIDELNAADPLCTGQMLYQLYKEHVEGDMYIAASKEEPGIPPEQKENSDEPPAPKRKPGRPKKNPDETPAPKRKPGRPKKNSDETPAPKRKPGRPKKNSDETPAPKRKPGRPKKNPDETPAPKRKPGRPKKNSDETPAPKRKPGRPKKPDEAPVPHD